MKTAARILLCAMLFAGASAANAQRVFNQAELDALLAPIALYPDPVLSHILAAASTPEDVREAAAWSRANPQLRGDEALRAVEPAIWHPSVKALVAYPDILARLDESPAWLRDLGEAYRVHGHYVMDTVQQLRRRAQASGYLASDDQQRVYEDAGAIVVAPVYPNVVYVRYYDPYIVYGPWWWHAYRPIVWRPYRPHVVVHHHVVHRPAVVHRREVVHHRREVVHHRPVVVHRPVVERPIVQKPVVQRPVIREHREPPRHNGQPSPAARMQQQAAREQHHRQQQVRQQMRKEHERRPHGGRG
jgi:hypothetical protein